MRRVIWKSTDFFQPLGGIRYEMDPIVIEVEEEPLPIYPRFNIQPGSILGYIDDIRIENGDLTGEVVWIDGSEIDDEAFDQLDVRLAGEYQVEIAPGTHEVKAAILRTVSPVPEAMVPREEVVDLDEL